MKRVLKKIGLISVIMVLFSIYNFSYATEEDGRFVDIPVPPSSSGRADFTSEEAEEQTKTYEEIKNDTQQNSETLGQNSILYKGTGTTITQNETEENKEQQVNEEMQTENENYIGNTDNEENNVDNNEKITDNELNKKIILICVVVVIILLLILSKIMNEKNKEKRKRK